MFGVCSGVVCMYIRICAGCVVICDFICVCVCTYVLYVYAVSACVCACMYVVCYTCS